MADKTNKNNHLIDDQGVYTDVKQRQATIFIVACRIVTVVLIVLGILALVAEYT